MAQIIEPLQDQFDNKIPESTFIDSSLLGNEVLATNAKGDKLVSSKPLGKSLCYVAIKMHNDKVYYGLVLVLGNKSNTNNADVLSGLKIKGQFVASDGSCEEVFMLKEKSISSEARLFQSEQYYGHIYSEDVFELYSFLKNGVGKFTCHYNIYDRLAPQKMASSWREGYTTHYSYSGGFYFDVEGASTQSTTWRIKGDTIIIKYGKAAITTKATLGNQRLERSNDQWIIDYQRQLINQFKRDLPTNDDVIKTKNEVKATLGEMKESGEIYCRFFHIDGVGLVLFPKTARGCDYSNGFVLKGVKSGSYWRGNSFDAEAIAQQSQKAYAAYRKSVVTSNQKIYNKFISNATKIFNHIKSDPTFVTININTTLNALLKVKDQNLDDGLGSFAGTTEYSIFDVDPNTKKAKMLFVRQNNGKSQLCHTYIHFDENGLLVKDALNAKFIKVSNATYDLKEKIIANHAHLKKNKKDKKLAPVYKKYQAEFKTKVLTTEFTTFDEMDKVVKNLEEIVAFQEAYCKLL